MEKELPIQIVKFRENDDFLPEGGGGNELPKWIKEETIRENISTVSTQLELLSALFEQRKSRDVPILTIANLNNNATAKSYRGYIRSVFDVGDKRNIIGMNRYNELLVKFDNNDDLNIVRNKYSQHGRNNSVKSIKWAYAAVEDLHLFKPQIDNNLENKEVKIRLVDYLDNNLNQKCREKFEIFCSENNLIFESMDYSDTLTLFRVDKITSMALSRLATMDGVISVREMPHILITAAPEPEDTKLGVKKTVDKEIYPIVGLLDTGIEPIPHLNDWIIPDTVNLMNAEPDDINKEHGTSVAGILLYGDELEKKEYTKSFPFKIQDCIVNSSLLNVSEFEMVQYIKGYVQQYPDIKVWNLSQGSNVEISDYNFSDFAIALDDLQKHNDIIICKSAGNQNIPGENIHITEGAESVMSLVVGSLSSEKYTENDGEVDCRSPFSRIGYGPDYLIKPDLVHYGGNFDTKIRSFSIYGNEALVSGTSFSTPRVTAIAASLCYELGNRYNPLLVKALMIHSASYPERLKPVGKERLREVGYGIPANGNDILFNDKDEFTMIFNTTFDKGHDVQVSEFVYPKSLIDEDGYYYGDITITLAVDPILNPNESTEYCQSEIDVKLETYDRIEIVDLGSEAVSRVIRNTERLIGSENILCKTKYSKKYFKAEDHFTKERTLIEDCLKYQPIKKYHITLDQITPKNKDKFLKSNRKWALKLKSLYRDASEVSRGMDGISLEQKVVLIITIKDPMKKGVVYNECMQQLRSFVHNDLILHQHVHVDNKN
jgi:hypothetical protein